jgi:hypothetical protein
MSLFKRVAGAGGRIAKKGFRKFEKYNPYSLAARGLAASLGMSGGGGDSGYGGPQYSEQSQSNQAGAGTVNFTYGGYS